MKPGRSLISGLIGACTLTLIHQTVRRFRPDAPRADVLGMEALAKVMGGMSKTPPSEARLHQLALAGDLVSNSLYYSGVGSGNNAGVWLRGAGLGLFAGLGAVGLPGLLGLDPAASNRTSATKLMTVAWYTAGGLAAAAAAYLLAQSDNDED
jgi:hypothetical protein